MLVHELQIRKFRNLHHINASFSPGINVIYGLNAQGKTNLLEAVYLLVTGRSFRTSNDGELIPWNTPDYDGTLIRATVSKNIGEEQIAFFFNGREKRVLVDGKPITRLANLIGKLNAVLFTPSDLLLVRGAPSLRRRFLDIAIGQTSIQYIDALQSYQQVLKNRNILLKKAAARGADVSLQLDVYDEQLADTGAIIMAARNEAVTEMSGFAAAHYAAIASSGEPMAMVYEPDVPPASNNNDLTSLAESIHNALLKSRPDDLRRLATSHGPHRDDFIFMVQDYAARHYASQGQQRTAVLAIKLAELDYLRAHTGESPLLMLDDLMSELDEERKGALLRYLDPTLQTFITTTDPQSVTRFASAQRLLKFHCGELSEPLPAE